MADFSALSAPPAFLPTAGAPLLPWTQWCDVFQTYMLASGGDDLPDKRKRALLLHCLGVEGQNVFRNLKDGGESFKSAMVALEKHFAPKVNVVSERYKFRQRAQLSHESVEEYANVLRGLASRCQFGELTEEMIRDQIIEKTRLGRLRERLLIEADLTLEKTLQLAAQSEAAAEQAREMEASAQVSAVYQPMQQRRYSGKVPNQSAPVAGAKCYRCGSSKHLASHPSCAGLRAKCAACGRTGHFTKCCRSKTEPSQGSSPSQHKKKVCTVDVMNVGGTGAGSLITHDVLLSSGVVSAECQMLIDTGSAVSIIPEVFYHERFAEVPLTTTSQELVSVMGQHLPVKGCVTLQVTVKDKHTTAVFYVVDSVKPILGLNVMSALALTLSPGAPRPVAAVKMEE